MKLKRLSQLIEESATFEGHWELSDRHEVYYRSKGDREEVKLQGSLLAAEPDALILAVTQRKTKNRVTTSLLKLSGAWQLDKKNRITFEVEREFGIKDILTFQGTWEVNRAHEVIYTYKATELKRGSKEIQTLTFKGRWDITEKNCLTYLLEGNTESAFRIRGTFQTQSILAKQGEIRCQFGIEAKGKRKLQTVSLFGKWKLSRDLELSFEIESADGKKYAMVFGAEFNLGEGRSVEARLINKEGDPLGLEVIFTQKFMEREGGLFLRLRKSAQDSALEAGFKIPW